MILKKTLAIGVAVALLLVGCGKGDTPAMSSDVISSESSQAIKPSSSEIVSSEVDSSSVPASSEPEGLYDGGQDDPTLSQSMRIKWEHIEYKNFGSPETWKPIEREASYYAEGQSSGAPITLLVSLPERIIDDGVLEYDGDFANGTVKMGDGIRDYQVLKPGETAAKNTMPDVNFDSFTIHPMTGEKFTMSETTDNISGGYCYGNRGNVSFARYIQELDNDNNLINYVIQLGDSYMTSAYFYVSKNATVEDLKLYDEIALSVKVKE